MQPTLVMPASTKCNQHGYFAVKTAVNVQLPSANPFISFNIVWDLFPSKQTLTLLPKVTHPFPTRAGLVDSVFKTFLAYLNLKRQSACPQFPSVLFVFLFVCFSHGLCCGRSLDSNSVSFFFLNYFNLHPRMHLGEARAWGFSESRFPWPVRRSLNWTWKHICFASCRRVFSVSGFLRLLLGRLPFRVSHRKRGDGRENRRLAGTHVPHTHGWSPPKGSWSRCWKKITSFSISPACLSSQRDGAQTRDGGHLRPILWSFPSFMGFLKKWLDSFLLKRWHS